MVVWSAGRSLRCDLTANEALWGLIGRCVCVHAGRTAVVPVAPVRMFEAEPTAVANKPDVLFNAKQSTGRKFGPTFSNSFEPFLLATLRLRAVMVKPRLLNFDI